MFMKVSKMTNGLNFGGGSKRSTDAGLHRAVDEANPVGAGAGVLGRKQNAD